MELKRRDQSRDGYVWLATYDHQLMYDAEVRKILSSPEYGLNENGFPKVNISRGNNFQEIASIHLKDFDMAFGKIKGTDMQVHPFLTFIEGKVTFLKLYLMPFGQFEKFICHITGCLPFLLPEKIMKSIA